jgi:hypothetical protein
MKNRSARLALHYAYKVRLTKDLRALRPDIMYLFFARIISRISLGKTKFEVILALFENVGGLGVA